MIRVRTGSRLHFGLLNPAGVPGLRRFGGVGLMIEEPAVCVVARRANVWSAKGPSAARALDFAKRCADPNSAWAIEVESAPPEHVGFGSGTQLGLAVARALSNDSVDVCELCRRVGRGLRSGLGAHGFVHGGFLVDGGKVRDELAPLLTRIAFPETWRIVIALPEAGLGLHEALEQSAFQRLTAMDSRTVDVLCRLVLMGLLPALLAQDVSEFGEALFEFNAKVGEVFAQVQGGVYSSIATAEIVAFLRKQGIAGVGQSSWGPTVFAIVADPERADHLLGRLRGWNPNLPAWATPARNRGALGETLPGS
jgi:beta-RFAP synthase